MSIAVRFLHPWKRHTRAPVLTGGPGAAPGVMASMNGCSRGKCAYREGPFPIAHDLCRKKKWQLVSVATKVAVGLFPAHFLNMPNTRMPPPSCPWATRQIRVCCPRHSPLVLVVEGAEGVCSNASKCNHHHHNHHHCFPPRTTTTTTTTAAAAATTTTFPSSYC